MNYLITKKVTANATNGKKHAPIDAATYVWSGPLQKSSDKAICVDGQWFPKSALSVVAQDATGIHYDCKPWVKTNNPSDIW